MKTNKALKILKSFSNWRKGQEVPTPNFSKVAKAIDVVVRKYIKYPSQ